MPGGRPTIYTEELGDYICSQIAQGRSLNRILKEDEGMPCMMSIFRWLRQHKEFSENYVEARQAQAEYFADETLEIADDGTNDWMEQHDKDGNLIGWRVNGEVVARSRLRVDTRKWFASKMFAKKFGDRSILAGDPDSPLKVEGPTNDVELARLILFQLAKARAEAEGGGSAYSTKQEQEQGETP